MSLAAEPLLGSSLRLSHSQPTSHLLPLSSPAISSLLSPGLPYSTSSLWAISSSHPEDSTALLTALLTEHLLSPSENGDAILISTSSTLDVRTLFQSLRSRCHDVQTAKNSLGRLRIMRVFDTDGLLDAVGEVSSPQLPHGLVVIDGLDSALGRAEGARGPALAAGVVRALKGLGCPVLVTGSAVAGKTGSGSVFASCEVREGFGRGMEGVDVRLLLHRVPRGARDARAVAAGRKGEAKMVVCVEVVRDRIGGRRGRYAFFTEDGQGGIKDGL